MTSYLENRQIRVFISSTFEDMKEERDILIRKVFPRLNRKAMERNVTILAIDLRWGITEENVRNGKVVRICLNEIDNSNPFFIGLLGDRYGWCPDADILKQDSVLSSRYQWIQDEIEHEKSMTEIEIQYGALRNDKEDNYAFFFLKEDSEKTEPKQRILKDRIKSQKVHPSYTYSNLSELELKVEETFDALLDRLFPSVDANEIEMELKNQKRYLLSQCESYVREEEYFKELDDFLYNKEYYRNRKAIVGECGMGKSALIANWIKEKLEEDKYNIAYYFLGNSIFDKNPKIIWSVINAQICDYYDHPKDEIIDIYRDEKAPEIDPLCRMLAYIPKDLTGKKPLLIVLDGCEKLYINSNYNFLLGLLAGYVCSVNGLKVLVSTAPNDRQLAFFLGVRDTLLNINPLKEEQKYKFIESYLSQYGKKLSADQIIRIVKTKVYDKPLALQILLGELVNFGIHEKLDQYIQSFCCAESVEELFQLVLETYEEVYGFNTISRILSTILVSENGMYEKELIQLANTDQLNWSAFYSSFSKYFYVRNGLIQLANRYIRDAVSYRYLKKQAETLPRDLLIDHLKEHIRSQDDNINENNVWIWNELIHQYLKIGKEESLHQIVMRRDVFQFYIQENEAILKTVWRHLLNDKSKGFSLFEYLDGNFNRYDIDYLLDVKYFISAYFSETGIAEHAIYKVLEIVSEMTRSKSDKLEAYVRLMKSEKFCLHKAFIKQRLEIATLKKGLQLRWNINEDNNFTFYRFIGDFIHKVAHTYDLKDLYRKPYVKNVLKESLKIKGTLAKENQEVFLPEVGELLYELGIFYTNYEPTRLIERLINRDPKYFRNWLDRNKKLKQKKYRIGIKKFSQALEIFRKLSIDNPGKYQNIMFQLRKSISNLRKKL